MSNYCTFYLVRHGQTEWNVKGLLQGHADSPLTDNGISQAKELGEKLKNIHFDAVFSSDSLRAKRTAEIIILEKKLMVQTTQLLREKHFGKYEGKHVSVFANELKHLVDEYEKLPDEKKKTYKMDDIENDAAMMSRLITFLREIALGYSGKTVLIATHGMMMRALLVHLGFGTYKEVSYDAVSNTAYVKIKSDGVDLFIEETEGITIKR